MSTRRSLAGALMAAIAGISAGQASAYVTPEWLPLLPENGQTFTAGPYGWATPADIGFGAAWLGGVGSASGDRCGTPQFTIASWPTIEGPGDGGFPSRNVVMNQYASEVPGPYADLWANADPYPSLEPGTYYWYAWAPVRYDNGYITSCGFFPAADNQWARSTISSFTVLPAPPASPGATPPAAARPATPAPPFYAAPGITSTRAVAIGRRVRVSISCPGGCPNAYGYEVSLSGKARVKPGSAKRRFAWLNREGSNASPRATKVVTVTVPASWRGTRVTATARAWDLRYGTPWRQAIRNGGASFNENKQTRLAGRVT